ncbi:MAG: hypothetical protein IPN06_04360 [Burkholderiales bacterium]|jgi:hypothetical protein|nr:hypothetical protein [Burkholderiales bacterium]
MERQRGQCNTVCQTGTGTVQRHSNGDAENTKLARMVVLLGEIETRNNP